MDREVESIDGDQSMHSAHSEHHYMPLATGWWCFCPASRSSRIAELASCDVEFDFVNFGVKALMKTISNMITLVCWCIHILFYSIQKPFPILSQ
jgi:hypothetical protein